MREGIIVRVTLSHFVTYDSVTVRPGPRLNMIVGPNGTGKSSIVAAIILGLGGKPKVIGRGSTVNSFIKMGCANASIEIELQNPNGPNHVVKRSITQDNKSEWRLNGNVCSQKTVGDLVIKLDIQVDNLCLFLPQDRVQDFAKMNRQALFENTMKCIGEQGLLGDYETLKELGQSEDNVDQELKENTRRLEVEVQRNASIELDVESIKERQNLLKQITLLNQKLAWLEYYQQKEELAEVSRDKAKGAAAVKAHESKLAPFAQQIQELKKEIQQISASVNRCELETKRREAAVNERIDQSDLAKEQVLKLQGDLETRITQQGDRAKELELLQDEASKLRNDLASIKESSEEALAAKMTGLLLKIDSQVHQVSQLNQDKACLQKELDALGFEIRNQEEACRRLDDVKNQRLEQLRTYNCDIYKAVIWFRENRNLFQGQVYEPMLLELNVLEPQYCKYIEGIVPLRDLQAFTCETKLDMNLLINNLRGKQGLRVNVLFSGPEERSSSSYSPRRPIQQLQPLGFHSYAIDLVKGPEAILKYLCKMLRLYDIPIGNDYTYENSDKVPSDIRHFYTANHVFNISTSRYSGQSSTRTMEISPGRSLTAGANPEQVERQNARLQQTRQKWAQLEVRQQERAAVHMELKKGMDSLLEEKRVLKKSMDAHKMIQTRLKIKEQHIRDIKRHQFDVEAETAKCDEDVKVVLLQAMKSYSETMKLFRRYQANLVQEQVLHNKLQRSNTQVVNKTSLTKELERKVVQAREVLQMMESRVEESRAVKDRLLRVAMQKTDGVGPKDPRFREFEALFEPLPPTIETLNVDLEDKVARAACLGTGDATLILEYEERQKKIAELRQKLESRGESRDSLKEQREQLKGVWLPQIKEFVDQINAKFSEYFALLECAGEVSLYQGENEDDFEHYGLSIRVRFRDSDELQELTRFMQSGGERAVSTAIYLISLQGLVSVPFCCVDEINQGMDEFNERLVVDLLVATTSRPEGCQYFMLSPKLLPSLDYSEDMTVLFVCNGTNCKDTDLTELLSVAKTRC